MEHWLPGEIQRKEATLRCKNKSAFTAILWNGSSVSWGDESCGGNVSSLNSARYAHSLHRTSQALSAILQDHISELLLTVELYSAPEAITPRHHKIIFAQCCECIVRYCQLQKCVSHHAIDIIDMQVMCTHFLVTPRHYMSIR